MEKKLLLIVNPRAGRTKSRAPLFDAVSTFCAAGYLVSVQETKKHGDATRIAAECGAQFDVVVCVGGDGTLNETLNGLMRLDGGVRPHLAYLPAGSTNDFGVSLGISPDPAVAARAVGRNSIYRMDVGTFNGSYFAYVASFGAFTRTSYTVPQDIKNIFGRFAYFLDAGKDLETLRPYRMKVTTECETFDGEYIFGAVSNSTSIAGLMKYSPDTVQRDDGKFELLLVPVPKNAQEMQSLIHALLTQDYENRAGLIFRHVTRVCAETEEDIPWTIDGELAPAGHKNEIGIIGDGIGILV